MNKQSRRQFVTGATRSLLVAGFTHLLLNAGVASDEGRERLEPWLTDLCALGRQLCDDGISQRQWQAGMDELYGRVSLEDLLQFIDFEKVSREMSSRDLGSRGEIFDTLFVGSPDDDNTPGTSGPEPGRRLISKIAHVRKGRSIPPHGHGNMVSAFLNISGEFHVRQFDKLCDEAESLVVRPTTNERSTPGTWSSISDYHNNVHWLSAKSDDCFLFTTKLIHLDAERRTNGRIHIDVLAAEPLGRGLLRAPKIDHDAAMSRY